MDIFAPSWNKHAQTKAQTSKSFLRLWEESPPLTLSSLRPHMGAGEDGEETCAAITFSDPDSPDDATNASFDEEDGDFLRDLQI